MTKENNPKLFSKLVNELYRDYKSITLPAEYAYFIEDNLMRFLIRLARYKFACRMISRDDAVLEVGCGSGLGAMFISQHCRSVEGVDTNKKEISEAATINRRKNLRFRVADIFSLPMKKKYDVLVALDVIEHMPLAQGRRFISRAARLLKKDGMLILGTPSVYSYDYQGKFSRAAHVKLYDQDELRALAGKYFGRVLAFSMNDELVHTGFPKMSWYYFILGFVPKV